MPSCEDLLRHFILTELAAGGVQHLHSDEPLFESVLDSTSVLALVEYMEGRFQIEIRDSEVVPANFNTLAQLCAFLERKTHRASSPLAATG